jgi:hypothetical protein
MENDDRYTRITLRIPKALHEHLTESAEKSSKSMNAEIIARLEESYFDQRSPAQKYTEEEIVKLFEKAAQSVTDMIAERLDEAEVVDPKTPGEQRRLIIRKRPKHP